MLIKKIELSPIKSRRMLLDDSWCQVLPCRSNAVTKLLTSFWFQNYWQCCLLLNYTKKVCILQSRFENQFNWLTTRAVWRNLENYVFFCQPETIKKGMAGFLNIRTRERQENSACSLKSRKKTTTTQRKSRRSGDDNTLTVFF